VRPALVYTLAALGWVHACAETVRADRGGLASDRGGLSAEAWGLARICVGEAGWEPGADCPAIHAVLAYRAQVRRSTWLSAARAYSPGHVGRRKAPRRPWVAMLRPSGAEPAGWPQALPWARYRPRWQAVLELARRVVAGEVQAPCEPHHWGGPMDDWRAHRQGLERVECGATRNHFWRVPNRRPS
jgi:hypothetical protein